MTTSEYLVWLYEVGTGVVGWTDEQVMKTNMRRILRAYESRCKMMNQLFGGAPTEYKNIATDGKSVKQMMQGLKTSKKDKKDGSDRPRGTHPRFRHPPSRTSDGSK